MTPFQIGEGVTVACSGKSTGSNPPTTGLKLLGDGHNVRQSDISSCNVGIQIGDVVNGSRPPGNRIHVETDTIHGNGIGIKVVEGDFNFFKFDSIFDNDDNGDGVFAGEEGIWGTEMPILLNADNRPIGDDLGNS